MISINGKLNRLGRVGAVLGTAVVVAGLIASTIGVAPMGAENPISPQAIAARRLSGGNSAGSSIQATPTPFAMTAPQAAPMAHVDPASVGIDPGVSKSVDGVMKQGIKSGLYPSAVVAVSRNDSLVKETAYGNAVLYDQDNRKLDTPITASTDTIYDLASMTKLFTATSVMKLVEEGKVDLDEPVARYIPEFAVNGKESITVRQLLTHTSGLPAGININGVSGTQEDREAFLLRVKPVNRPSSVYEYSDVNFMVLGKLVERISGQTLDAYMAENIFQPLGMNDTMYNPPAELRSRVVGSEMNVRVRGEMPWGEVHDTSAYALGGVAGNAGLFSTGRDVAVFGQMIANGGEYDGVRVLKSETVDKMLQPQRMPSGSRPMGLGWELDQAWYMGGLAGQGAAGHTGYTGTSLVISTENDMAVVVLTNRVHPTLAGSTNPTRVGVANAVANALDAAP